MTIRKLPGDFEGSRFIEHLLSPFAIRAVSVVDEGQEVGRHSHEHAHLMLILSGDYLRRDGAFAEPVRPPFLLFDPEGTTHDDRFAKSAGSFVSLSIVGSADVQVPNAPRSLRNPGALNAALRLAQRARLPVPEPVELEGAGWEMLSELDDVPLTGAPPAWAFDAYDLVMDEAADPDLSIKRIAGQMNVHPVHLARVFRRAWGFAPADLLRWRRVERAAQLLADRSLAAAEIAVSVGFYDQSHMSRAFKTHFGLPPSRWQRMAMFRESKTFSLGAGK